MQGKYNYYSIITSNSQHNLLTSKELTEDVSVQVTVSKL